MTRSRKGKGTTEVLVAGDLVHLAGSPDNLGRVVYSNNLATYIKWGKKKEAWYPNDLVRKYQPTQPPKPADPEITSYYEAITEGS